MAQDTPLGSSIGATTGSDFGSGSQSGSRLGTSGNLGSSAGSVGSSGIPGASAGTTGSGLTSTGSDICPTCGRSSEQNRGLEQFLGRLGISDDVINSLKSSVDKVEVEEYLNTAREYLTSGSVKAKTFARENPGKVAAGVAVLAVGAGLLVSALNNKE